MKTIDTYAYVSALRELTEAGKEVSMLISGSSMAPFLCHQRDTIVFRKPDPVAEKPLKRGDMVFYQRASGQFVMHRIYRVRPEGLYIVGDAQTEIEGPVALEQVFAIVTGVQRKGIWIGPDDFWWKFFRTVWIRLVPLRPVLVKAYGLICRLKCRTRS